MINIKHKLLNLILFFTITFSLILGNANITQAIPWQELILRGIQVIQISNISDEQEVEFGAQIRQQLIAQRKVKL